MIGFQEAVETVLDSWLRANLHTLMPGHIVEVTDRDVPLATVQPDFMRVREGKPTGNPWPVIPNVPILFPVFGDYGILSDIKAGTGVLLAMAERSIATWINEGGIVDPTLNHMFDMSDCFAIPGILNNKTKLSKPIPDEGMVLRKLDGDVEISLTKEAIEAHIKDTSVVMSEDKIVLNGSVVEVGSGSDAVAMATATGDRFAALQDAFTAAVAVPQDGGEALMTSLLAALSLDVRWTSSIESSNLKAE